MTISEIANKKTAQNFPLTSVVELHQDMQRKAGIKMSKRNIQVSLRKGNIVVKNVLKLMGA